MIGRNPVAVMFDDGLGFAAQVAVLDLVARDNGVPVHALLGQKVRDRCPISWWDIDMPPADWAAEARESVVRGYAAFKMKARPWRDIFAQVEAAAAVVPGDYKFDIDFNGFLLDQARSEICLAALDGHRNVGMYETPYALAADLDGALRLRELPGLILRAALISSAVLLILGAARAFAWVLVIEGVPQFLAETIIAWELSPILFLLAVNVLLLLFGLLFF